MLSKLKIYMGKNEVRVIDLANKMNLSSSAIATIAEKGIQRKKTAKRYARFLKCDFSELLEDKNYTN